jgi:hypothetical protein
MRRTPAGRRRVRLPAGPAGDSCRGVNDRLAGLLLFLPVPFVLWLFTWQPLGPWASLGLGVLLVATHRLYARPFALARAARRCLWCGGAVQDGVPLVLREPVGETRWRVCGEAHDGSLRRTLGWAARRRRFLAFGILGSLAAFFALALAAAASGAAGLEQNDAVACLRLGVAMTVLPFGWLAPARGDASAAGEPLPFPVHIQALIGTRAVLWLFRLVGLWWLAAGGWHLFSRLA